MYYQKVLWCLTGDFFKVPNKKRGTSSGNGEMLVVPPSLQDNYEPVEMDIDSNPDSPGKTLT